MSAQAAQVSSGEGAGGVGGKTMNGLRKHQIDALTIARDLVAGTREQKIITASVTPGGGKTLLASIFAHELIRGDLVDHVCVLAPRDALRSQVRDGFTDVSRGLDLRIAAEGNKGLTQTKFFEKGGYVTTYHAVVASPARHARRFRAARYLLVLDEPHHLSDEQNAMWKRAVEPLVESATYVLLMSGTMTRDDGAPIAFVRYDADRMPIVDIKYTRREALDERAILPVSVKLCDGEATYWHRHTRHEVVLSEASKEQEPKALRTMLEDATYRHHVLKTAIDEWRQYRALQYKSRAIVVAHDQITARAAAAYLRDECKIDPVLAISEHPGARHELRRFQNAGVGDVLVTCQMAYEGLDVPDCTHLICLTHIRSKPWLDQALARVTRMNTKCGLSWEQQMAFIYVPNDPSMVAYLDEALDEQDAPWRDAEKDPERTGPRAMRSTFQPIEGEPGAHRYGDIHGVFGESDCQRIERFKRDFPAFAGHPASEILPLARQLWPDVSDMAAE